MYKDAIFTQVAKAKLVYVKEKDTYKILFAFNVTETNKNGTLKFPSQKNCAYVSGDLPYGIIQAEVERVVTAAKQVLRTNNIEFV